MHVIGFCGYSGSGKTTLIEQLIAELVECDWVLVEGFKHAPLAKIEVWRAATGKPVQYPNDPFVIAIATDSASSLPEATALPVLDLDDPDAITQFIVAQSLRCLYAPIETPEPVVGTAAANDASAARSGRAGEQG